MNHKTDLGTNVILSYQIAGIFCVVRNVAAVNLSQYFHLICHCLRLSNSLIFTIYTLCSTQGTTGNVKLAARKFRNQSACAHFSAEICRRQRHLNTIRKLSCRWQTRATRKHAKNCSNSTCLQCWPIFIRLLVVASEICEIPRNSLKIQTYGVQDHPRSSILVSIESPHVTSY